jgi:hypothetical protein
MAADPNPRAVRPAPLPNATYKPTLFDRVGPDAGVTLRAWAYGLMTFGLSIPLWTVVAMKIDPQMSAFTVAAFVIVCSATVGAIVVGMGFALSKAAGGAFKVFAMGGGSTPYREQYSREQALVMRGEVDEALASFGAVILAEAQAVDPRIRAAELYAREKGDPGRAAELFRGVQRITTATPGEFIYATNRLVDLYTGPLADPGRALVELRRLIERYPSSTAATHARKALSRLKAAD